VSSKSQGDTPYPRPIPVIEVAAGLLFRGGRLLISERKKGSHLAGFWEFPGGKREPGESWQDCLSRELHEELSVHVQVGMKVSEAVHTYPEKVIHIAFFRCLLLKGEPQSAEGQNIRWVSRNELTNFSFPAADASLVATLIAGDEGWS
jgi:8-oxo-dGTP diphosphatase